MEWIRNEISPWYSNHSGSVQRYNNDSSLPNIKDLSKKHIIHNIIYLGKLINSKNSHSNLSSNKTLKIRIKNINANSLKTRQKIPYASMLLNRKFQKRNED